MLASAEWAMASALEAAATTIEAKAFWSQVGYIGGNSLPVFGLLLALRYSRMDRWLTPHMIALYWVGPVLATVAAFTNDYHHLVWPWFSSIDPATNLIVYGHGPVFWGIVVLSNSYVVASIVVLAATTIRDPNRTFAQTGPLIVGYSAPWFTYVAYVAGASPMPHLDLTPIGALLSGFILYLSIARYRLFELLPIARETLVEEMSDGLLVFDGRQRLVDHNRAALSALRLSRRQVGPHHHRRFGRASPPGVAGVA